MTSSTSPPTSPDYRWDWAFCCCCCYEPCCKPPKIIQAVSGPINHYGGNFEPLSDEDEDGPLPPEGINDPEGTVSTTGEKGLREDLIAEDKQRRANLTVKKKGDET